MKKLSFYLSVIVIGAIMAGCSPNEKKATSNENKASSTTTESKDTINNADENKNSTNNTDENKNSENKTEETKDNTSEVSKSLSKKWSDNQIQLNGKVLTMPISLNDLKKLGFEFEYKEKYVLNPGDSAAGASVSDNKGHKFSGSYSNLSDKIIDIKDSSLTSINIRSHYNEGMDIVFPGGIKFGDSIDKVKQVYGDPQDTYNGDNDFATLTYKQSRKHYLQLTFSKGKLTGYELYI